MKSFPSTHYLAGTFVQVNGLHPPVYGEVLWDYGSLATISVKHKNRRAETLIHVAPANLTIISEEECKKGSPHATSSPEPEEAKESAEDGETPEIYGYDAVVEDFRTQIFRNGFSTAKMPNWSITQNPGSSGSIALQISYERQPERGFFQ